MIKLCYIARQKTDGTYERIICKSDGNFSGVGQMLIDHYNDAKKAMALIKLGNIITLGKSLDETDTIYSYNKDWFAVKPKISDMLGLRNALTDSSIAYLYVFTRGKWLVHNHQNDQLMSLKTALEILKTVNAKDL